MADNINRLAATGKQKFLKYSVRQPYKVQGFTLGSDLAMLTSQNEYLKTSFM